MAWRRWPDSDAPQVRPEAERRWMRSLYLAAAATVLACSSSGAHTFSLASQNVWREGSLRARMLRIPRRAEEAETGEDAAGDVPEDEDEEGQVLYFGGATEERTEPQETEAMQIAGRINEALALKRVPKPVLAGPVDTAWYDELGVPPSATSEEIRLKYLEIAEEVEENLAFLLEQGEGGEYQEQVTARDDEDDDEFEWTRWEEEGEDAIALQPESSLAQASPSGEAEEEADILAEEFYRVSNLYQILSVPSLRKIYDEGGVEGLAMRVPALSKGLLEPERVLKMAQGIKTPTKVRESLLLRQEPRIKTFRRYQGKNSIRQVLRRITDCIRVWCFKSKESLKFRSNTIYEELPEIAVFGRVNAGKSAMLQHLFSATKPRKNGHFSVAQRPGKTKGIQVYCMNRRFTVADMPSYGKADDRNQEAADVHANWTQNWEGVVQEYLNTTHWLRAAIYVHEISKEVIPEDLKTIKMLRKQNIPILLVFTKDDKVDSETHRHSRVMRLRRKLKWPMNWPHAHYTTRRGGYGQVFKNMVGTMMLGLVATEQREDAWFALKNELPDIFWDYRDKYVPKPRTFFGRKKALKKSRTYPDEDVPYTDEELEEEE
ncbi:unnamed protein product, partial [Effrenium voratum]